MTHLHQLIRVQLTDIRPTQISVGEAEVRDKRRTWKKLSKHGRRELIDNHAFPAVLGPKQEPYIVDHHHLGLALLREGVEDVWITLLDDFSWLKRPVFWRVMEFRSWAHPYNAKGLRCEYHYIPTSLHELKDDPYRSLAAITRDSGGYAKTPTPFAEFLWADYFRTRIALKKIAGTPRAMLSAALRLARGQEARYLPGWSGQSK